MVGEILPGGPSRVWKLAVWAVVAGDVLQYSSKCHHWKSQLSSSCRRLFRDTSDSHRASKLSSQPEILEQSLCQSIDDDTEDDDDSDDHEMISVVKLTPRAVTDIIDLPAVSCAGGEGRARLARAEQLTPLTLGESRAGLSWSWWGNSNADKWQQLAGWGQGPVEVRSHLTISQRSQIGFLCIQ